MFTPLVSNADSWFGSSNKGVAPVNNKLYATECSACHYAYQPGLLPARSWKKIMSHLENHFGENAELSKEETQILMQYAMDNAADKSKYKRSVKINRSIHKNETPLRITEVGYIKRKHHELSKKHVENNPEVKSLANCNACHTKIDAGSFSEREINIPGYGHWED
jgi:hypothetical protein